MAKNIVIPSYTDCSVCVMVDGRVITYLIDGAVLHQLFKRYNRRQTGKLYNAIKKRAYDWWYE